MRLPTPRELAHLRDFPPLRPCVLEGGTTDYIVYDEPPRLVGGNAHDRRKRRRLVQRILRGEHRRRR